MTTPPPSPPDPWAGHGASGPPNYEPPSYPQPAPGGYPMPAYPGSGATPPGYPPPGYPPAGYGPPAYPSGGYAGAPPPTAGPPARPNPVTAAFWLWMGVMVAAIVSAAVLFTGDYFAEIARAMRSTTGIDDHGMIAAGADVARVAVIFSTVVALFIYLFFGLKMLLGRHWARVVLTVLGGLAVLSGLSSASALGVGGVSVARPAAVVAVTWVQVVLAAIAVVLMYLPAANRYFRDARVYRAERRQLRG